MRVVSSAGNGAVTCRRGGGGRRAGPRPFAVVLLLVGTVAVVEDEVGIGELQEERYVPIDPHAALAAERGEGLVVLDAEGEERLITPGLERAERTDDDDDDDDAGTSAVK